MHPLFHCEPTQQQQQHLCKYLYPLNLYIVHVNETVWELHIFYPCIITYVYIAIVIHYYYMQIFNTELLLWTVELEQGSFGVGTRAIGCVICPQRGSYNDNGIRIVHCGTSLIRNWFDAQFKCLPWPASPFRKESIALLIVCAISVLMRCCAHAAEDDNDDAEKKNERERKNRHRVNISVNN